MHLCPEEVMMAGSLWSLLHVGWLRWRIRAELRSLHRVEQWRQRTTVSEGWLKAYRRTEPYDGSHTVVRQWPVEKD